MNLSSETLEFLKNHKSKRIVFTNGCFDILHRGHVTYVAEARKHGDALIVGVNSDSSVRRLKGSSRPINLENDRAFVLKGLKSVDAVEIFCDDTPLELIKMIKPSVLVKGGDWKIDQIIGASEVLSWGGKVLSLNFVDGFSTTSIIERSKS